MKEDFAHLLQAFIVASGLPLSSVARQTGVPRPTLRKWREGLVRKPQHWEDIVRVATALALSRQDADRLIQAAGYPTLPTLYRESEDEAARHLFQPWLPFAVPFEPPPLPTVYVGRGDAEAKLGQRLTQEKIKRQAIWGMAGVGKSSLAIRVAHLLRADFPDGVIWLQLDQLTPLAALGHIAASFGDDVSGSRGLASRSAHIRSLLGNKQALLILDNVTEESQLKPLLPSDESPCAVLVTTRRALSTFSSEQTLSLNPFAPEDDAYEQIFARTLPVAQFGLFRPALAEMAALLGYLPLALAIIAGRIKLTPHLQPEMLLARLRQEAERLSTLQQGESSVEASFNVSFALLKPAQQRLFAQLGRLGRAEFDQALVAAMSGLRPYEVDDALSDLYQLAFLNQGRHQHYRLHPLLHDFARAQVAPEQTLPRLIAYYRHFLTTHPFAYQQIDNELAHIREVGTAAQAAGCQGDYVVLVSRMLPYYLQRGEHQLAQELIDESWAHCPDTSTLARLWLNQGALATLEGRFADAMASFAQVMVIVDSLDNSETVLRAQLYWYQAQCQHLAGNVQLASTDYRQALALAEQAQVTPLQTRIMAHMAVNLLAVTQDYAAVIAFLQRGLQLARQDRDVEAELPLLVSLGSAYFEQGQWELALATYHDGQQLAFTTGRTLDNIKLHNNMANVLMEQGVWDEASRYLGVALRLSEAIGSLEIRLRLLTSLGALNMRRHEWADARRHFQEVYERANAHNFKEFAAFALIDMASVDMETGAFDAADSSLERAGPLVADLPLPWLQMNWNLQRSDVALRRQRWSQSIKHGLPVLEMSQAQGLRELEGEIRFILAQAYLGQGDRVQAALQGRESLAIWQQVGSYKAERLQQWLTDNQLLE